MTTLHKHKQMRRALRGQGRKVRNRSTNDTCGRCHNTFDMNGPPVLACQYCGQPGKKCGWCNAQFCDLECRLADDARRTLDEDMEAAE